MPRTQAAKADGPGGTGAPQGHRGRVQEYSSPQEGAQGTTGTWLSPKASPLSVWGCRPQLMPLKCGLRAGQGFAPDFSWGPCACAPRRAATVASGGLRTPIPLGGPGDSKGPKGTVCPSPSIPYTVPPRVLLEVPGAQGFSGFIPQPGSPPRGLCPPCGPQAPSPRSRVGQCLCRNHVQQAPPLLPAAPVLSCFTTARGPFQNQPPPRYGGEAPILAAPSPRPGVKGHACRYCPNPCPGRRPGAQAWGWVPGQGPSAEEGGQRTGGSYGPSLRLPPGPLLGSRRPPWPAMETQRASAHPGCIYPAPEH